MYQKKLEHDDNVKQIQFLFGIHFLCFYVFFFTRISQDIKTD